MSDFEQILQTHCNNVSFTCHIHRKFRFPIKKSDHIIVDFLEWSIDDLNKSKSTCTEILENILTSTSYPLHGFRLPDTPKTMRIHQSVFPVSLKAHDYQGPVWFFHLKFCRLSITTNFNSFFPNLQVRVRQWRWYQAMGGWLWRSLSIFSSTNIWVSWYVFLISSTNLRHVVFLVFY